MSKYYGAITAEGEADGTVVRSEELVERGIVGMIVVDGNVIVVEGGTNVDGCFKDGGFELNEKKR